MRYTKWFASIALAAGMAVAGTTAASAQDWRDTRHEYNRADWLRSAIARDRARLAERFSARQSPGDRAGSRQLERHEAELRAQVRDSRYDRGYRSNGGYSNGYTDNSRNHR